MLAQVMNATPSRAPRMAEETKMALYEHRGSHVPRQGSALCMAITVGGLIAVAVAIKWLIELVL